jgi:hypothetical protein
MNDRRINLWYALGALARALLEWLVVLLILVAALVLVPIACVIFLLHAGSLSRRPRAS